MPEKSFVKRAGRFVWRSVFGDRVLLPQHVADSMWHLRAGRERIRGGELVVRFANLNCDIALDARSDIAMRALGVGYYEPELISVLTPLVGQGDVLNVGANVGIVAIAAHRVITPGRKVVCVEPFVDCIGYLRRNLETAGIQDAIVVEGFATFVAEKSKTLWTVPGKPEYSSGGRIVHPSVEGLSQRSVVVNTVRLDELVALNSLAPTLIVMDCEGGEHDALQGGAQTLKQFQPVILAEFDDRLLKANGTSAAETLTFLRGLDYRCLSLVDPSKEADATTLGTIVAAPAASANAVISAILASVAT